MHMACMAGGCCRPVECGGPVYIPDDVEADEDVRSYVSALWAEDWDCAEDQVYDRL